MGLNPARETNGYNDLDAPVGGSFFMPSDNRVTESMQCTRRLRTLTAAKVLLFAALRWFNFKQQKEFTNKMLNVNRDSNGIKCACILTFFRKFS